MNGYIAGLVFTVYLYVDCTVSRVSVGGAGLCRLCLLNNSCQQWWWPSA